MRTIFRYPLSKTNTVTELQMPVGATVLSVHYTQEYKPSGSTVSVPSIWCEVETNNDTNQVNENTFMEARKFLIFGTGANMDDTINFNRIFIGTIFDNRGYAFHVFEVKDNENIG